MLKLISIISGIFFALNLAACSSGGLPPLEKPAEIEGEITLSAYDTMIYGSFLEEGARLFMERHPGTKINIETFSSLPEIKSDGQGNIMVTSQDDTQARQDYLSKINTALMSGEGADILAMDILPFYKYAEKGQLEDLTAYLDDLDPADYPANIWQALEYQGGVWFMPLDYTFNFYTNYLEEPSQLPPYTKGPFPDLWEHLLAENYSLFVDFEHKQANFTDGSFEELLLSVKDYGEGKSDMPFYKQRDAFSLISFFTRDMGIKTSGLGEGGSMDIGDDEEPGDIVASAKGTVGFTYRQAYAINGESGNKELAWAFIKFLLGEEMQLNGYLPPSMLPLGKAAREEKLNSVLTSIMEQNQPGLNESINGAFTQFSAQINTYIIRDAIIDDMIDAEVQYFFSGTKSAAEVGQALENKVSLYLNE